MINKDTIAELKVIRKQKYDYISWKQRDKDWFRKAREGWFESGYDGRGWITEDMIKSAHTKIYVENDIVYYRPHLSFELVNNRTRYRWFRDIEELEAYLVTMDLTSFIE